MNRKAIIFGIKGYSLTLKERYLLNREMKSLKQRRKDLEKSIVAFKKKMYKKIIKEFLPIIKKI